MKRFIARHVAMFRLLWLSPKVKGEFPILQVDEREGQTFILLPDNADTKAPGTQSLFWNSRQGHCIVEFSNLTSDGRWFKVLHSFGEKPRATKGAWLSGWLGERPEHFGLREYDTIKLEDGTQAVLTKSDSSKWVIHVHGRKTLIGETLRNFPLFQTLGYRQLAISHKTDPKPMGLGLRRSTLGLTEWKSIELAVIYAQSQGATEIILFGWSLGGMICGQYLKNTSDQSVIKAAIFDSPMFDVRNTLRFQAMQLDYPAVFADEVCELIRKSWLLRILGYPRIVVDDLSLSRRALSSNISMLVLYSLEDGYIQIKDAVDFGALNPSTQLQEFNGARHCRLRNSNVELYEKTITNFVAAL